MLRGVKIDAGIDPALHEKFTAKIEVLVLRGRAQPAGKSRAMMHHNGAART